MTNPLSVCGSIRLQLSYSPMHQKSHCQVYVHGKVYSTNLCSIFQTDMSVHKQHDPDHNTQSRQSAARHNKFERAFNECAVTRCSSHTHTHHEHSDHHPFGAMCRGGEGMVEVHWVPVDTLAHVSDQLIKNEIRLYTTTTHKKATQTTSCVFCV